MKSLKTIQVIAKIFSILSLIVFICSIIGAISSLISISVLCAIKEDSKLWQSIVESFELTQYSINAARCAGISSFFNCAENAVLFGFSRALFKRELALGTPFDKSLAKQMLRDGILNLTIPIGTTIIVAIFYAAFGVNYKVVDYLDFTIGIVYIIVSLICSYGADLRFSSSADNNGGDVRNGNENYGNVGNNYGNNNGNENVENRNAANFNGNNTSVAPDNGSDNNENNGNNGGNGSANNSGDPFEDFPNSY